MHGFISVDLRLGTSGFSFHLPFSFHLVRRDVSWGAELNDLYE